MSVSWGVVGRHLARGAALIGAIIAFILCVLKLWNDQSASAGVAAGLCLVLALLAVFDIDVLEAFGIKATLRRTLSDAEERLRHLSDLLLVLGKAAFKESSRGARTDEERRELVAELTTSLEALGVTSDQIDELKRNDIYKTIAFKLNSIYLSFQNLYTSRYSNPIHERLNRQIEQDRDPVDRAALAALSGPIAEPYRHQPYNDLRRVLFVNVGAQYVIEEAHRAIFADVAEHLSRMLDECVERGNYTDQVIRLFRETADLRSSFFADRLNRL